MPSLFGGSISKKLTWMNMLVSSAALALACAALFSYDLITFRQAVTRQLSIEAQIIASNSVTALLFDDPDAAQRTLSALAASPHILAAGISRHSGQAFAAYRRRESTDPSPLPPIPKGQTEIQSSGNGRITLVRQIIVEQQPVGTVYIQSDLSEVNNRLRTYGGIVGLVLAISLAAAWVVSRKSQKAISEPIQNLSEAARVVSRNRNYAVRVAPSGGAQEIAVLVGAFNDMLSQIQERDGALQKARDELEVRVQKRTAELEIATRELEEFSLSMVRAKEEVERASKFKDQFLSTMSHELRTPLNAVLGFSDLLKDDRYGPLNERQARYVGHINTGGQHLLKLINDILDLSKIEAGRLELTLESVSVKHAFVEVLSTLRTLADKKEQILSQRGEDDLTVRADSTRFKQVLMNLVGNAIKFTPARGQIELAAGRTGETVRIEVHDNGPGISPQEQERIFEAFYRTRNTAKSIEGTGLGLAITQRLVQLHGGKLGLESQSGQGSCFHFSLPVAASAREHAVREPEIRSKQAGPPRILVIEDDAAAAQLIESLLLPLGYEVVLCDQPARALDMAVELLPGAITLDLLMKPVSGWEVLGQLRSDPRTANVPVVVISIADQPSTGTILGADEYIVKPVNKTALLEAIERCVGTQRAPQAQPILIVEDDASTREIVAEILTSQGYLVELAVDGAEARAKVGTFLPDLVILDLLLPKVSGFELLAEWRANSRTANLPIFVLTSKDLNRDEEVYLRSHAEYLFRKQQSWQETLVAQVRRVMKVTQMEIA